MNRDDDLNVDLNVHSNVETHDAEGRARLFFKNMLARWPGNVRLWEQNTDATQGSRARGFASRQWALPCHFASTKFDEEMAICALLIFLSRIGRTESPALAWMPQGTTTYVPFYTDVLSSQSLESLYNRVKETSLLLRKHISSFSEDLEKSGGFYSQTAFSFNSDLINGSNHGSIPEPLSFGSLDSMQNAHDLHIKIGLSSSHIDVVLCANQDQFTKIQLDSYFSSFVRIVEQLAEFSEKNLLQSTHLKNISLCAENDHERILKREEVGHQVFSDFRADTLNGYFEQSYDAHGSLRAMTFRQKSISYKELDLLTLRLASFLRQFHVKNGSRVGLMMNKSHLLYQSLLAILRAGGAYVPLDPALPASRVAFMIADSQCEVVMSDLDLESKVIEVKSELDLLYKNSLSNDSLNVQFLYPAKEVDLKRQSTAQSRAELQNQWDSSQDATPYSTAYIIYTSGSTGNPKGVLVPHRSVINLIESFTKVPRISRREAVLCLSNISFDMHIPDVHVALAVGAEMIIPEQHAALDAEHVVELIEKHNVTFMQATPSAWQILIDSGWKGKKNLRAIAAGEPVPRELARKMLSLFSAVWNGYGPTETTVYSTFHKMSLSDRAMFIGTPVEGLSIYMVDETLQIVPDGVVGEILIGGYGVSDGYQNRDELNAKVFIDNPFDLTSNTKVYRSGDLGRRAENGLIECLGRMDGQVKIRGFRIETGEIEKKIESIDSVERAIVQVMQLPSGEKGIVAHVVFDKTVKNDAEKSLLQLKASLKIILPHYMLPHFIYPIDSIPMTINGKVNKAKLDVPFLVQSENAGRSNVVSGNLCAGRAANIAANTDVHPSISSLFNSSVELMREQWAMVLGLSSRDFVSDSSHFFDMGGSSILAVRLIRVLKGLGYSPKPLQLFQTPIFSEFVAAVQNENSTAISLPVDPAPISIPQVPFRLNAENKRVVLVGFQGSLPGARDVFEFWQLLTQGKSGITHFRNEEIDSLVNDEQLNDASYVLARGIIKDFEKFDYGFFGYTKREAELMDPQQRKFLQVAWGAFESAGILPSHFSGKIGVFAGVNHNTFAHVILPKSPDKVNGYGAFNTMLLNDKDYIATRVAHKFDLTGPAVNVQTACSTGLVALHQARVALERGECEVALVGGSHINTPSRSGYLYSEGGMFSPDGETRSFDEKAKGTVFSDGVCALVLCSVEVAERLGLTIYAEIEGSAINNDGANKASFTAPSVEGQAKVVEAALHDANIRFGDLDFIEAHGTATPLGDPIELEGLQTAYDRAYSGGLSGDKDIKIGIGSVKSNIGHITTGAGLAGVMKVALALYAESFPSNRGHNKSTSYFDFDHSPFHVVGANTEWKLRGDRPRRAGISSFGVGGTNAHVVLKEFSDACSAGQGCVDRDLERDLEKLGHKSQHSKDTAGLARATLFIFSGRSPEALMDTLCRWVVWLESTDPFAVNAGLDELSWTLFKGRIHQKFRKSIVASSKKELCNKIRGLFSEGFWPTVAADGAADGALASGSNSAAKSSLKLSTTDASQPDQAAPRPKSQVTFLFPGQGSQCLNMGASLYVYSPEYRKIFDELAQVVEAELGFDLRLLLGYRISEHSLSGVNFDSSLLNQTKFAQPALFCVSYSMAVALEALGVRPDFLIGHSVGEFVAAARAGVFSPTDGARLVATRGSLMQEMQPGVMLSVRLASEQVRAILPDNLDIAAVNSPKICVVAGHSEAISEFEKHLETRGIGFKRLQTSHAFHSRMMEPAVDLMKEVCSRVKLSRPQQTIISSVTGNVLTDAEAMSADYWSMHLRETVNFEAAVHTLEVKGFCDGASVVLEVGPRATLSTLFRQCLSQQNKPKISSVIFPAESQDEELSSLMQCLGQLWEVSLIDLNFLAGKNHLEFQNFLKPKIVMAPSSSFSEAVCWPVTFKKKRQNNSLVKNTIGVIEMKMLQKLESEISALILDAAGIELSEADYNSSFLELGLDSLFLTQIALKLKAEFEVDVRFRKLMSEFDSVTKLASHLEATISEGVRSRYVDSAEARVQGESALVSPAPVSDQHVSHSSTPTLTPNRVMPAAINLQELAPSLASQLHATISAQTELMMMHMQALVAFEHSTGSKGSKTTLAASPPLVVPKSATEEAAILSKPFGAIARIEVNDTLNSVFSEKQKSELKRFTQRYESRTKLSKEKTQSSRKVLADPRVVTGFKPHLKELVYQPIVVRAKGSKLWDLDGNEYIDCLNGFGMSMFGWSAEFITHEIKNQIDTAMDIGAMSPLAAEVAQELCQMVKLDRAGFCNTGSEAVLGCVRIARTVTGRKKIVSFTGAYHGIFDEVLTRGLKTGKAIPAAPGIMADSAANIYVLEYGAQSSLEFIKEHAHEIAGVLCETIQSRNADFQPKSFLKDLRELTLQKDICLIFDEVITGFRLAPGGAQEYFGIEADLAAYGKVIGGGFPIGVIAGKAKWADALDGGFWQFGDESVPECGVTYFAGTFVRHPPALAAARAVLRKLKTEGVSLQNDLNSKTAALVSRLRRLFELEGLKFKVSTMGSLWRCSYEESENFGDLFFVWLRSKGLHIYDGFPCFLTTAHSEQDIARIEQIFVQTIAEMKEATFFSQDLSKPLSMPFSMPNSTLSADAQSSSVPPVFGAIRGRNTRGEETWFIKDEKNGGLFKEVLKA